MILKKILCFLILLPFKLKYKIEIFKLAPFPKEGGVLLIGNHISWIDWAILQLSFNRCIKFVMNKDIYNFWLFKKFLEFFGVIPISSKSAKDSIKAIKDALNNFEVVCIFPEGTISYTGNLNTFKKGFEIVLKDVKNVKILPFYIKGLWGGRFSRAQNKNRFLKRKIKVVFGKPFLNIDAFKAQCEITKLSCIAYESENIDKLYENKRVLEILNITKTDQIISSFSKRPFFEEEICENIKDYLKASRKIAKENIFYLFCDEEFLKSVVFDESIHPLYFSNLKYVFVFGKINSDVLERFERKFKKTVYYGYIFKDVLITLNLPDVMETKYFKIQRAYKEKSFGKPFPGAAVCIKDENQKELNANEIGKIWVKSYAFDWMETKDFGYLDKECFLHIKNDKI